MLKNLNQELENLLHPHQVDRTLGTNVLAVKCGYFDVEPAAKPPRYIMYIRGLSVLQKFVQPPHHLSIIVPSIRPRRAPSQRHSWVAASISPVAQSWDMGVMSGRREPWVLRSISVWMGDDPRGLHRGWQNTACQSMTACGTYRVVIYAYPEIWWHIPRILITSSSFLDLLVLHLIFFPIFPLIYTILSIQLDSSIVPTSKPSTWQYRPSRDCRARNWA